MNREEEADFLAKTFVISMVSFLLLEALLPSQYRNIAFLFLVLEATILWVLRIARSGLGPINVTARMLATYIAFFALILRTEDEEGAGSGGK